MGYFLVSGLTRGDGGEFQLDAVTAAVSSVYFVECIYFFHKNRNMIPFSLSLITSPFSLSCKKLDVKFLLFVFCYLLYLTTS